MALRLASKINRHFIHKLPKGSIKALSTKTETASVANSKCAEKAIEQQIPPPPPSPPSGSVKMYRYQVCRPRTSPLAREKFSLSSQLDVDPMTARKNMDLQLQPSMLPEYLQQAKYAVTASNFGRKSESNSRFEVSKTVKNVTLPLKAPKLANPFPEPVKVMPSHTVSDQEKAEQMLADSKVQSMSAMCIQKRGYATEPGNVDNLDPSKCKKLVKKDTKKACPKMVAPGCIPPKSILCMARPRKTECTKKEAPYPSYSESCHEDIEQKPSECKLCPWRPEDNPNFKPKKSSYHTSATMRAPLTKGDCTKPPGLLKEPCGWVKKEKEEDIPISLSDNNEEASKIGYLCDLKKLPFDKCVQRKRRTREEIAGGCPPKPKKKKIQDCPATDEDKDKKCAPASMGVSSAGGMPKFALIPKSLNEMSLQEDKDKAKKKCPKVNLGVCKDDEVEEEDPCGRKRKPRTDVCKPDLLKRYKTKKEKPKPRPKKADSAMITPQIFEISNQPSHKSL